MCPRELAVYIDIRLVVDGAEVQEYPAVKALLRYLKMSAVADGVDEVLVLNTGESALRAERNENFERELFLAPVKSAVTRGAAVIYIPVVYISILYCYNIIM